MMEEVFSLGGEGGGLGVVVRREKVSVGRSEINKVELGERGGLETTLLGGGRGCIWKWYSLKGNRSEAVVVRG